MSASALLCDLNKFTSDENFQESSMKSFQDKFENHFEGMVIMNKHSRHLHQAELSICLALGNHDELIDTLSGKGTLYDTVGICYQNSS